MRGEASACSFATRERRAPSQASALGASFGCGRSAPCARNPDGLLSGGAVTVTDKYTVPGLYQVAVPVYASSVTIDAVGGGGLPGGVNGGDTSSGGFAGAGTVVRTARTILSFPQAGSVAVGDQLAITVGPLGGGGLGGHGDGDGGQGGSGGGFTAVNDTRVGELAVAGGGGGGGGAGGIGALGGGNGGAAGGAGTLGFGLTPGAAGAGGPASGCAGVQLGSAGLAAAPSSGGGGGGGSGGGLCAGVGAGSGANGSGGGGGGAGASVPAGAADSPAPKVGPGSLVLAFTIIPPVSLTVPQIVDGFVGLPFSEQLTATGGVPPYHFSLNPETPLPAGLTLSPSGLVSGTPATHTIALLAFSVTDSATPVPGFAGSNPQDLLLNNPNLVITTGELALAQVGHAYAQKLSADMGAAPLHWSISAGTLPGGLSLNAGTGAITGTPSQAGTSTFTVKVTDSATPTAQTATSSFTLTVDPTVLPEVFVTNGGNSVVNAFALGANGDASPLTTLGGSMTALDAPSAAAIDPTGRVYLANSANNTVTEYANGTVGNSPPSSTIGGTATGLATPTALALDANGLLYVANGPANTITVFASGAHDNATPVATIAGSATQLTYPSALAVDHAGNLWVANLQSNALTEYRPGSNGNVGPAATISGYLTGLNGPQGMTVDPAGDLLVANTYGNSITEYKTTDNGSPSPQRLLFGSSTGLSFPRGIDVDSAGNIYVANNVMNTVAVYAPSANNNTGPMQVISGSGTGLRGPVGLAVAPPLALLTTKLAQARVGHRYDARLRAVLGTTPYRFTVIHGHLPRGISLSRSGRLTGRPGRRGTYRFTVRVTDSTHRRHMTSTRRLVLRVRPR